MKNHVLRNLTVVVFSLFGWSPSLILAQSETFDAGTPVAEATAEDVTTFIETFIDGINNHDGSIVDLVAPESYLDFFANETYEGAVAQVENLSGDAYNREIVLYDLGDVREHETGHSSAKLTYSGWSTDWALYTNRWYLSPTDTGYLIDAYEEFTPEVPEDMASVRANITYTNDGLIVDETELDTAEILLIQVKNTETVPFIAGVFAPATPTNLDRELILESFMTSGFEQFNYLGPMPVEDGEEQIFGFLVEPGTTYVFQQFGVPGFDIVQSTQAQYLPGEQFIGAVTIAAEQP